MRKEDVEDKILHSKSSVCLIFGTLNVISIDDEDFHDKIFTQKIHNWTPSC